MLPSQVSSLMGSYPRAAGYPGHSGVEIPEVWSKTIAKKFQEQSVIPAMTSGEYSGEIKQFGENLMIRIEPDIPVYDYSAGQELKSDVPQATIVSLTIDRGLYYNLRLDDVTRQQMDVDWTPIWTTNAAYQLNHRAAARFLSWLPTQVSNKTCGVAAGNSGTVNLGTVGAPVAITKQNAIDYIVYCGQILDEFLVPEQGRYITLPPPFITRAKLSDVKAVSVTGDQRSPLRNGKLGDVDAFSVLKSSQVASVADPSGVRAFYVPFGHRGATIYAQTVIESSVVQSERFFGKLYRGLQVYGHQVLHPEYVGVLYCYFPPELEGS